MHLLLLFASQRGNLGGRDLGCPGVASAVSDGAERRTSETVSTSGIAADALAARKKLRGLGGGRGGAARRQDVLQTHLALELAVAAAVLDHVDRRSGRREFFILMLKP